MPSRAIRGGERCQAESYSGSCARVCRPEAYTTKRAPSSDEQQESAQDRGGMGLSPEGLRVVTRSEAFLNEWSDGEVLIQQGPVDAVASGREFGPVAFRL